MIIDGHAHACGEYLTEESIRTKLSKNRVDCVVLTPGEPDSRTTYKLKDKTIKTPDREVLIETNNLTKVVIFLTQMKRVIPKGNENVAKLKLSLPGKVKQAFWLTKKQWNTLDDSYSRMKFDILKMHQCWEYFDIRSEWFSDVIKWINEKDIPLFIHMYSYKDVMSMIDVIKANPKTKIIVAHLFGAEFFIKDDINHFDNVYFDLSNAYFVSKERMYKTYKHFGSTKLLMGSDTPYGTDALEKTMERIRSLNIKENEKDNILGNNIKALLRF